MTIGLIRSTNSFVTFRRFADPFASLQRLANLGHIGESFFVQQKQLIVLAQRFDIVYTFRDASSRNRYFRIPD